MKMSRTTFGLVLAAGIVVPPDDVNLNGPAQKFGHVYDPSITVTLDGPVQNVNHTGAFPDLVVTEIAGPAEAYVGDMMLINLAIENWGTPLGVGYEYQTDLVISTDQVLDGSDTVLDSFMIGQSNLGLQQRTLPVPTSFSEGNYYLGLRIVDPVPGDVNPANNSKVSDLFQIVRTNLQLEDGSPLIAFVRTPEPAGPNVPVRVNNVGTDQSILLYTVTNLGAVPWLSLDPTTGVSVSGADGSDINLQFNHAGLLPGDYFTTLRFQNDLIPSDFQDLSVQLTVGEAYFMPGQVFEGQITGPGDLDTITFDGIKGLVVTLRTKSLAGNIKPVLTVIDPDGIVEAVLQFKHSGTFVNKKVKLAKSGTYTVEVTGKGLSTGSYRVRTDRLLPMKAKPRTIKLRNPAGGGNDEVDVLILPGAILEYRVNPNGLFTGPATTALTTPLGGTFDISGNTVLNPDGSLVVSDLHLNVAGRFVIGVHGWGANPDAKATVQILPIQPPRAEGTIYLP
ncbi:MAG: hypothetical protein V2A76_12320 [Planctomycetota bacterium]